MKYVKQMLFFLLGGTAYVLIELLWRGRSHISMFCAGGLCLVLIGRLEQAEPKLPLPVRILAGAGIITAVELGIGLLVNRDYTVWDYRAMPGNFLGQICPAFCLAWIPLSALAGFLFRRLNRTLI